MKQSAVSPVVLVTGAAKRLGQEISLMLAAAGWKVAVHFHNSAAEAEVTSAQCADLSGMSSVYQCDLADEAAVRALLPKVVKQFGRIDAIVNSASLFAYDNAETFTYATLQEHMVTNAGAAILLAQSLCQQVKLQGGTGAVVNLLDQKLWNLNPDFLSYTLSKASLEAANTMLALALAPHVRVVGVAPGLTLTSPTLKGDRFEQLHAMAPLGHSSTSQDIALTVKFALENSSITGTTLVVDGGQHLVRTARDFSMM